VHRLLHANPLQRRLITIPAAFGLTIVALSLSPLLAVAAITVDLVTGPRRLRAVRLLVFGINYLLLECGAVLAAFALWLATGFGLAIRRPWSKKLHAVVERWWITSVVSATQRWMRADYRVEGLDCLARGPIVVVAQHASFFDAVLPAALLAWASSDAVPRYALKREMLLSPAIDIIANRLPNHFVDRTPTLRSAELDGFTALADDLGQDALVVFPEGTFHTPERFTRALERISRSDPDRAARVAGLRHMLPARPGGVTALLDAAPDVDIALIAHHGFQRFGSIKSVMKNLPFHDSALIRIWRIKAEALPPTAAERLVFLDEQWLAMDQWITDTVAGHGGATG
jgi:1-acyl-sn-glycerol-3-phosphate acyltransferase